MIVASALTTSLTSLGRGDDGGGGLGSDNVPIAGLGRETNEGISLDCTYQRGVPSVAEKNCHHLWDKQQ